MPDRNRDIPRRPATLDDEEVQEIVGDGDPAEDSAAAHASAWALMGVADDELTQDMVEALRATVRTKGVAEIAPIWTRSPDFTLPGALWRLYLLSQWHGRDPKDVRARFDAGADLINRRDPRDTRGVPDFDRTIADVNALLRGDRTDDDLEQILGEAARAFGVIAAGSLDGEPWITNDDDPLAHPVTRRARALLLTGDELDQAARRARVGALD